VSLLPYGLWLSTVMEQIELELGWRVAHEMINEMSAPQRVVSRRAERAVRRKMDT
jgi:hypothetical protein